MSFPEFVSLLAKISVFTAIPAVLYYLLYRKHMSTVAGICFAIILTSCTSDQLSFLLIWVIKIRDIWPWFTTYPITNSYSIVDFLLVNWLMMVLLPNRRLFIKILIAIFLTGSTLTFFTHYNFLLEANIFSRTFSSMSFIVLSCLAFVEMLKQSPTDKLADYPIFWLITSLFLFSSTILLTNIFRNYLNRESLSGTASYAVFFIVFFNTIKNFMFLYVFILFKRGNPDYIIEGVSGNPRSELSH